MLISMKCPSCGFAFKVDAKYAGRRGKCPQSGCGTAFVVPSKVADSLRESKPSRGAGFPACHSVAQEPPSTRQAGKPAPHQPLAERVDDSPEHDSPKTNPPVVRTRSRSARKGIVNSRLKPSVLVGLGATAALALLIVATLPFLPGSSSPSGQPSANAAAEAKRVDHYQTELAPFLQKYCFECHSGEEAEADIALNRFTDQASVLKKRAAWERVLQVVQGSIMPPKDATQPPPPELAAFTQSLDSLLHEADCGGGIDPGRVTIRRLNRAEYNNTVRDLLGVTVQPAADFPSDDVGYGFDNIGDVLSLPPLLMEKYLAAAEKVAAAAIVIPDPAHAQRREFTGKKLKLKGGAGHVHDDDAGLYSSGEIYVELSLPRDGDYLLRAKAGAQQAGKEPARMEFRWDGKKVTVIDVTAHFENHKDYEFPFHASGGKHRFAAAFINDFYDEKKKEDRNLYLSEMEVRGPIDVRPDDLPESHRRLITVTPGQGRSVEECAREILKKVASRAYRRPVRQEELSQLVDLVKTATDRGESFEAGMQFAVEAVLISPYFLFRIELDPQPDNPSVRRSLNDYELASRLSYFLWSSMPDEELFTLAERGELHKDAVLQAQVKRMLKDPKSAALVENFAGQWLQLRVLDEITPDPKAFPEFNDELRADMRRETAMFFEHVMREDRGILEFIDGRYTFLNKRLAAHYGIPNIDGDDFRKVSLDGLPRGGLLTQASILTLTSNPNRTSPVKRGKWILESILGAPPPPPPPNVPELEDTAKAAPTATLREQMLLHRQNPACGSCHRQMDDLGFGFENFDAIGRWREKDGEHPVDAAGELPNGGKFSGPMELAQVLKNRKDEFARCLTEKLLTYALGRGLEYYDRCTVNEILKGLRQNESRFSALVTEIVRSEPFRRRRGEGE